MIAVKGMKKVKPPECGDSLASRGNLRLTALESPSELADSLTLGYFEMGSLTSKNILAHRLTQRCHQPGSMCEISAGRQTRGARNTLSKASKGIAQKAITIGRTKASAIRAHGETGKTSTLPPAPMAVSFANSKSSR